MFKKKKLAVMAERDAVKKEFAGLKATIANAAERADATIERLKAKAREKTSPLRLVIK